VTERDVGQCGQNAAMYRAAGIAMFFLDAQPETQVFSLAFVIDRADEIEERTGTKQRSETFLRGGRVKPAK